MKKHGCQRVDSALLDTYHPRRAGIESICPNSSKGDYTQPIQAQSASTQQGQNQSMAYYGSNQLKASNICLRAGPLLVTFDPEICGLREVRIAGSEVLHGVIGSVRDRYWNTVLPVISNLKIDPQPDAFRLRFDALCQQGEVNFYWHGEISGDPRGKIVFVFNGEARSVFWANRIGLCVLHSAAECAGKQAMIEHSDGSQSQALFPFFVAPQQPMQDLRAITHEIESGLWAELRFQGGIFEMEDQRNWTDAAFKTYSPPLTQAFPVKIDSGFQIQQTVVLSLRGTHRQAITTLEEPQPELVLLDQGRQPKAAIGLGYPSHKQPLKAREIQRLHLLGLSHLRLDIDFAESGWRELLKQASKEARSLNAGVHLALHLTHNAKQELDELAKEVLLGRVPVNLWMVLPETETATTLESAQLARQILEPCGRDIPLAAGTGLDFAALNRNRTAVRDRFIPCFSLNPQVHDTNSATMVENLGTLKCVLDTLRQFAPLPVAISPITLRPRDNPVQRRRQLLQDFGSLPFCVDPRQLSLFGAGWTLGTLSRLLASPGVHSLTYYETTGWMGVMEREEGSPLPNLFRSTPGMTYPMYHLFADLAGCNQVIPVQSSHPRLIEGLGLVTSKNTVRVLAANLTDRPQTMNLKTQASAARIRFLDEINIDLSQQNPEHFREQAGPRMRIDGSSLSLRLLPCALVRIDFE